MRPSNYNIITTPVTQLYLVRTNLTVGTTGDTRYFTSSNEMYTGKSPNQSVEILDREIKNQNQQIEEGVSI
jgi:hypothetical protein